MRSTTAGSSMYLSGILSSLMSLCCTCRCEVIELVSLSMSCCWTLFIMLWPNMMAARPEAIDAVVMRLRRRLRQTLRQARISMVARSSVDSPLQAGQAEEAVLELDVEIEGVVLHGRRLPGL